MARQEGVQSALQMRVSSFLSGKPIQQVVEQAEADLRAAQERLDQKKIELEKLRSELAADSRE